MSDAATKTGTRCRVTEIVEQRLRASMYIALRSVRCDFQDGRLTLRGIVPSFYVKQVMFSLLDDLESEGIQRIHDEIDVIYPHDVSGLPRN